MVGLRKPATASGLRTTTAVTVFRAGQKVNSVPGEAVAYVKVKLESIWFDVSNQSNQSACTQSHGVTWDVGSRHGNL